MIEDSVDSESVEKVKVREELYRRGSRGFDNEFDVRRCEFHDRIVRNFCMCYFVYSAFFH